MFNIGPIILHILKEIKQKNDKVHRILEDIKATNLDQNNMELKNDVSLRKVKVVELKKVIMVDGKIVNTD